MQSHNFITNFFLLQLVGSMVVQLHGLVMFTIYRYLLKFVCLYQMKTDLFLLLYTQKRQKKKKTNNHNNKNNVEKYQKLFII